MKKAKFTKILSINLTEEMYDMVVTMSDQKEISIAQQIRELLGQAIRNTKELAREESNGEC